MNLASLLIGAVFAGGVAWFNHWYARRFDGLRERAEAEFRQLRIEATNPAMCFDGRSAVIVHERCDYLERTMVTVVRVHRYARNAHGEYFMFISEGTGRPFFKHVEQRLARIALGERYLPPPEAHR